MSTNRPSKRNWREDHGSKGKLWNKIKQKRGLVGWMVTVYNKMRSLSNSVLDTLGSKEKRRKRRDHKYKCFTIPQILLYHRTNNKTNFKTCVISSFISSLYDQTLHNASLITTQKLLWLLNLIFKNSTKDCKSRRIKTTNANATF